MTEIIKNLITDIITLVAVYIGARLSQNNQLKHLRVQHITETHEK